jgi:4-oxalocrotonate tautomerase
MRCSNAAQQDQPIHRGVSSASYLQFAEDGTSTRFRSSDKNWSEVRMPLARIDLIEGKPREYVAAIGESVHRAMVETIGVPVRDHFQVITEHAPGHLIYDLDYLEVHRTGDVVFIQIFLSAGRSREQKQAFFKRTAEYLRAKPGLRPEDVAITLAENSRDDWSFGNGDAQYVILPKERWK